MEWINPAQHMVQCWAFINMVMDTSRFKHRISNTYRKTLKLIFSIQTLIL